jgi:hypothetical protein
MTFLPGLAGLPQPWLGAGLLGLIALLAFVLSGVVLTRAFRPVGVLDALLFYYPVLCALVCATGYVLSALNALNQPSAWALAGVAGCVVSVFAVVVLPARSKFTTGARRTQGMSGSVKELLRCAIAGVRQSVRNVTSAYGRLSPGEKRLLGPLLFTGTVLALVNFDLARNTTPLNWDSMTYHLARVAYYLQHGNFNYYDANYWAQVTHPKNSAVLTLFTYLVANRNENLTQLVQLIAYGVATVAVYGICRRLGRGCYASLIASFIFALLVECLMQSITTQNDMLLTALFSIATYGLLSFQQLGERRYLWLTALCVALALGVKASALLVVPPLAVMAFYSLVPNHCLATLHALPATVKAACADGSLRRVLENTGVLVAALLVTVVCFALPAGYVENVRLYGNPIGTEYVRKLHSFEGQPLAYTLQNGTLNLLRFGMEFLSFDGLPPGGIFTDAQAFVRQWPRKLFDALSLNLETKEATRALFQYNKAPASHEDVSYWGVLGFALVLPVVGLSLVGFIRAPGNWPLAAATVLFFLAQSYSGPYDPWRGRYFIIMAVWAVPAVACCVRGGPWPWRVYLMAIVLLGCLSALTGVLGRWNNAPEEVYAMDRVQQLTRNRRNYTEPINLFEKIVPPDATVAVAFGEDTFEYPLFGEHLTRKLIPINSFLKGLQPIPPEAGYLIYSRDVYHDWRTNDVRLGEDWFLRILKRPN